MTSYLWGNASQAEFDALLDKTTSDLLPSSTPPDLLSSLRLADLIRSSSVPSASATKSLLKRLTHPNPNVQLLALGVFDICVKNGGNAFLAQVGAKECSAELEGIVRARGEGSNREVREKVKAKVQDWATAFAAKSGLGGCELVWAYERMKKDGVEFPPRDPLATAAMVDSLSSPQWTDSTYCTRCRTDFTTFNRKHHCRNCGHTFDQACSAQTAPLPHYGITEPVRVCDGCMRKLKEGRGATLGRSTSLDGRSGTTRPGLGRSSTGSYSKTTNNNTHRSSLSTSALGARNGRKSKEDEDLEKAIAASLLDVGGSPSSTTGPAYQLRDRPNSAPHASSTTGYSSQHREISKPTPYAPPASTRPEAEETDPDLAAAIAASLRDLADAPSAPSETYASLYPSSSSNSYPSSAAPPLPPSAQYAPLPSYDLSSHETADLESFSSAVLSGQARPEGQRERELYVRARGVLPKLERGMEDASRRRQILVEMNEKLGEATRLYGNLLEERVKSSEERVKSGGGAYSYGSNPYHQSAQAPEQQQSPNYATPSQQHQPPPQHQQQYQPYPVAPQPWANASQALPTPLSYPSTSPPLRAPSYPNPNQPAPAPVSQGYPQQPAHAQQQYTPVPVPQPAGYYKPSSFPAVPNNPLPSTFPSVPVDNPWEEGQRRERQEEQERKKGAEVGELIQF